MVVAAIGGVTVIGLIAGVSLVGLGIEMGWEGVVANGAANYIDEAITAAKDNGGIITMTFYNDDRSGKLPVMAYEGALTVYEFSSPGLAVAVSSMTVFKE